MTPARAPSHTAVIRRSGRGTYATGSIQMGELQARSMMVGAIQGFGGVPLRSASQVDQRQDGFSMTRR